MPLTVSSNNFDRMNQTIQKRREPLEVWINKGLVFNCNEASIGGARLNFAQSPQAILLGDRIRVFFCTRTRDSKKTWISKPAFIDFTSDFSRKLSDPEFVSISPPVIGAFDEHGIFPFHPITTPDGLLAFSTGWSRRQSVDVETGIGLLVSNDEGLSFERFGNGPILTASLHEPYLVCDGWVLRDDSEWKMWYLFGTKWDVSNKAEGPQRVYKIGCARSPNGIDWVPSHGTQIIEDVLGPDEAQALPSVRKKNGQYEMVFCYRPHQNFRKSGYRSYQLGSATSHNGEFWIRNDRRVDFPAAKFDDQMRCYPSWFSVGSTEFILFNGNDFGREGFGVAVWVP